MWLGLLEKSLFLLLAVLNWAHRFFIDGQNINTMTRGNKPEWWH
jgi:hypothetical protein